jgi:AraC-like DNA-binding protein
VAPARAYLDAHVAERVSLDALAALAGVSKFHFVRLFHRVVGQSPHAYQLRGRVELAQTLLTQGHSASRVAQETGFADHSHLIRTFRRLTGMTPTRFAVDSARRSAPTLVTAYGDADHAGRWGSEVPATERARAWSPAPADGRDRATVGREESVAV